MEWKEPYPDSFMYPFTSGAGEHDAYALRLPTPGHMSFGFTSGPRGEQGILGTGHAKEVFGHVVRAFKELVDTHKPKRVYFYSDSSEPSRTKFYDWLAARAPRILGPDYVGTKKNGDKETYAIAHKDHIPPNYTVLSDPKAKLSRQDGVWTTGDRGRNHFYDFETPGGKYSAQFTPTVEVPGAYKFKFNDAEGNIDITGAGHAKEVFSHIIGAVKHMVDKNGADHIRFSSSDDEPSRTSFYKFLTSRAHKILGPEFSGYTDDPGQFGVAVHDEVPKGSTVLTPTPVSKNARSIQDMYPTLDKYVDEQGNINLHHFTPELNGERETLEPKYFGKNKYTLNDKKVSPSPRVFFYTDPGQKEGIVRGTHYTTKVPASKVYDLRKDPEGLVTPDLGRTLAMVAGKGYHGIYYNTGDMGVVNWFHSIPVTKHHDEPVSHNARATLEHLNYRNWLTNLFRAIKSPDAYLPKIHEEIKKRGAYHSPQDEKLVEDRTGFGSTAFPPAVGLTIHPHTNKIVALPGYKQHEVMSTRDYANMVDDRNTNEHYHEDDDRYVDPNAVHQVYHGPNGVGVVLHRPKSKNQPFSVFLDDEGSIKHWSSKPATEHHAKTVAARLAFGTPEPKSNNSRFKAPANGAIVNNQYFPGGRFLPRVLQKIRDVRARKLASRTPKEPIANLARSTINPELPLVSTDIVPRVQGYSLLPLTNRQINNIEDNHGLQPHEKLKRTITQGNRVTANTEDIAKFFDTLADKRLSHSTVVRNIRDPNIQDDEKLAHLVNHISDEAAHAKRKTGNATQWYSKDIDELDSAIADHFGWKPDSPRIPLTKALIAVTSKDQQPVPNVLTAIRILEDAHKESPSQPFHHLRTHNFSAYDNWLNNMEEFNTTGKPIDQVGSPEQAYDWYTKWGQAVKDRGYMTAPTVINRVTKQPMGRKSGNSLIPFSGFTKDQMYEALKDKSAQIIQHTPKVSPEGKLSPKAWGPATSIQHHIALIKTLVNDLGEQGAADFLQSPHDIKDLQKYRKSIDRGDTDRGEPLSGAYLFGPKFAPFFENMFKKHDKLTADKWWSRTWNRYLGTLYDAANGEVTTPRSKPERQLMRKAAETAAGKLGMSVAELQATLWYYEQHLWRLFGATNQSQSFADAAKALREKGGMKHGTTEEHGSVPF